MSDVAYRLAFPAGSVTNRQDDEGFAAACFGEHYHIAFLRDEIAFR